MGNKNTNLQAAKNSKYDEFYTTYECIEREMTHYFKHFKNKVVLLEVILKNFYLNN